MVVCDEGVNELTGVAVINLSVAAELTGIAAIDLSVAASVSSSSKLSLD